VGLVFWPDASAAQLRNNFHVTMHRLRKALGSTHQWVTLVNDRYRVDPALVDEFDALAFERAAVDARRVARRGDADSAARLEAAAALFHGDFLDGEPMGDWHLEHRDRLQKLYVDCLMLLGERHELAERHAKAAEAFERVLARDQLHEEALLALLRAHAAMGERSHALRIYHRFAQRIRAELGADPDAQTMRFVERLQAGAV
jgi:DNA-binding SARP family transcriptional activator